MPNNFLSEPSCSFLRHTSRKSRSPELPFFISAVIDSENYITSTSSLRQALGVSSLPVAKNSRASVWSDQLVRNNALPTTPADGNSPHRAKWTFGHFESRGPSVLTLHHFSCLSSTWTRLCYLMVWVMRGVTAGCRPTNWHKFEMEFTAAPRPNDTSQWGLMCLCICGSHFIAIQLNKTENIGVEVFFGAMICRPICRKMTLKIRNVTFSFAFCQNLLIDATYPTFCKVILKCTDLAILPAHNKLSK